MKENELKFIELVEASNANFVIKLERILKSQVLSQLSRPMLNELFSYWKDNIDEKFNTKAVCMQCAASLFNICKSIAIKYFELKEIQKNELELVTEVIDSKLVEEPIVTEKNEIVDVESVEKNEIINVEPIENNEEKSFILSGETIFDSNTGLITVTTDLIPVENNEIITQEVEEKLTKRGRPKSK